MQNYAIYSENFEIYAFHYKTYGHGLWYDEPMTYDEAVEEIKKIIYAKVAKDNPHLDVMGQKDFQPVIEIRKEKQQMSDEDAIIESINSCRDYKWLQLWVSKSGYSEKTQAAYDKKFAELKSVA